VALVRLEMSERAHGRVEPLAPCADLGDAVDDDHPSVLLHLVVTELLAGVKLDEHCARFFLGEEHDRIRRSGLGRELTKLPGLHGERVYGTYEARLRAHEPRRDAAPGGAVRRELLHRAAAGSRRGGRG
jgi:hypothetical protein